MAIIDAICESEELRLLYKAEMQCGIPAAPVIRRLLDELERPLPDVLPPVPEPVRFKWPESGVVT